jgi:amidase
MVPIAHGTDGGGSIRVPASACGLVGLKPSRGRVSTGLGETMAGLSVEHVLTRSVRDSAAVLDVLSGSGSGDPYGAPTPSRPYADELEEPPTALRIGIMRTCPMSLTTLHRDVIDAVDAAARALEPLGHHIEEAFPPAIDEPEFLLQYAALTTADTAACLDSWSGATGKPIGEDDVEIHTWALAELGRMVSGAQLLAARDWLFTFARRMADWWTSFDLLLTPTLTAPPPPIGSFVATREEPLAAGAAASLLVPFTPAFNATGQPAISLPVAWNADGLPIGVQLVAAYGHEEVLIRVASQLEQACGWTARKPPVPA